MSTVGFGACDRWRKTPPARRPPQPILSGPSFPESLCFFYVGFLQEFFRGWLGENDLYKMDH